MRLPRMILLLVLAGTSITPAHCNADEMLEFCADVQDLVYVLKENIVFLDTVSHMCMEQGQRNDIIAYLSNWNDANVDIICNDIPRQYKLLRGNPDGSITGRGQEVLDSMNSALRICKQKLTAHSRAQLFIISTHIMVLKLNIDEGFCNDIQVIVTAYQESDNPLDSLDEICSKSKPATQRLNQIRVYLASKMNYDNLPFNFTVPGICNDMRLRANEFEDNPGLNTTNGNPVNPAQKLDLLNTLKSGLRICHQDVIDTAKLFMNLVHITAIDVASKRNEFCNDVHEIQSRMDGDEAFDLLVRMCLIPEPERGLQIYDHLDSEVFYNTLPFDFVVPEICDGIRRQSKELNTLDNDPLISTQKRSLLLSLETGLEICAHAYDVTSATRANLFPIFLHITVINLNSINAANTRSIL